MRKTLVSMLAIEADVYTPPAVNAPPPLPPSQFTLNLMDNLTRLGLTLDQILSPRSDGPTRRPPTRNRPHPLAGVRL